MRKPIDTQRDGHLSQDQTLLNDSPRDLSLWKNMLRWGGRTLDVLGDKDPFRQVGVSSFYVLLYQNESPDTSICYDRNFRPRPYMIIV